MRVYVETNFVLELALAQAQAPSCEEILSLAERGIDVLASSGEEELWPLVPGTRRFDFPAGTRFSVIGLSDIAGLTLDGVRWPLDEATIPFGSSRTLSNIVTGTLSVNMTLGKAFILAHPAAAQ